MSEGPSTGRAAPATSLVDRLVELLHEKTGARLRDELDVAARPLRDLPIRSRTMVDFLVAVETEFDFEWDFDTPRDVFFSLETMAAHLDQLGLAR